MSAADFYSVHETYVSVKVKARPGTGKDAILGVRGGELLVAVRAVAEKGRANEALARVLSAALGVPRGEVRLKLGGSSPHKVFELPKEAIPALATMEKMT